MWPRLSMTVRGISHVILGIVQSLWLTMSNDTTVFFVEVLEI